jgi:hypothetical protein
MKKSLKVTVFTLLFLTMLATSIWASLEQNLFTEWSFEASEPWFKATLVDFYINQLIFWIWVAVLEPKLWVRGFWLVFMFCTGSMGTCLFILYRLIFNKPLLQRKES